MRYRDVAVLMRSEPEYRDLIDASFAEHGIPFFSDRRRTASHHPLLRLIRASLAVARTNWGHEAIISTIKTGLAGLGDDEADALENYVLQQGIRHGMWIDPAPWTARRRRGDDADDPDGQSIDAQRIEILRRRLVDRLGPFVQAVTAKPQSTSVKSLAAAIFSLLESLQVRAKIVAWMDQAEACHRLEERSEHERVWDELVRLFDEMVDLLGDEPISLEDFAAILDTALEGFDLALTPPTVDQVLVGPVDRTRTPDIKACVVLGLSEGQFPRGLRQDTVFSDVDRRALGRRNFDLDPDTQRRLLDENFWFYVAMTRASHRLLLTRSTSGKSAEPIGPSPLWRQVAALFADLPTTQAPASDQLPLESIATPRQLISGLMRWVRDPRSQDADAWRALYQWLAEHEPCGDRLDLMRHRAWKALAQDNEPHLEPDRGSALFASPLHAALSQLESFRACPYQHFARYGLGLAPRQPPSHCLGIIAPVSRRAGPPDGGSEAPKPLVVRPGPARDRADGRRVDDGRGPAGSRRADAQQRAQPLLAGSDRAHAQVGGRRAAGGRRMRRFQGGLVERALRARSPPPAADGRPPPSAPGD